MRTTEVLLKALAGAPVVKHSAGVKVQRLVGFWVMLHTVGGGSYRQLDLTGYYGANTIRTNREQFRKVFGKDALDWYPDLGKVLRDSDVQP
jgi:hypothetical protein